MATVKKTSGPKPWQVRWRDEAGRQRKQSFPRRFDADKFRAQVEHQLHVGSYVDPAAGRISFRDYAEQWRLAQPHRPNTATRTASQLAHHAYPVLGDRQIAAIRPTEIQAWVTGLSTMLAASSVRPVFSTVRAIFAAAVRDRLIARTPIDRISLPELPQKRIVPLTVDQVRTIIAAVKVEYRAVAVVSAGAGLRQGEVFGLQVRDIDFMHRTIKVDRQVQLVGARPAVAPLKTRPSYRTVPVGRVVTEALAEHLRAYPAGSEDFIFRANGQPLSRTRFGDDVWRPAVSAAGLVGTGFHALRHFYASALIRAGLSVKAVSARLGHGNAAETLNTYSHLWPDDEDRTRQAIDDVLGDDVPQVRPAQGVVGAPPQVRGRFTRPGLTSNGSDTRGPPSSENG